MSDGHDAAIQLRTASHSPQITRCEDIELQAECLLDDQTPESYRRRILRIQWVDNAREADKPVLATILHQKRHQRKEPWLDSFHHFDLAKLRAGEEVRLSLSASESWRLYEALRLAYACGRPSEDSWGEFEDHQHDAPGACSDDDPALIQSLVHFEPPPPAIVDPLGLLSTLAAQHGEAFWELVGRLSDNLPQQVALQRVQQLRAEALFEFQNHLRLGDWTEPQWQCFFEANTWIFGFGLSYKFTHLVQAQAHVRSATFHGDEGQRGDFLLAAGAEVRFTVILDIKHPQVPLINSVPYRNSVYHVSKEVAGGVAQVQAYCRNWETQLAREMRTVEELHPQHIFTCQPKGFLVVGQTGELKGDREKATAFESFRRNLQNPEIITFDELLERARYIVGEGVL
jgi:hypothetical protein